LDVFDTSNIINNSQTTTSIKLFMTGLEHSADQAFIGFIGFSNDVYQPKVCYIEKLYNMNNDLITKDTKINVGDIINVNIDIKNIDNETATNIKINNFFDNNITKYKNNSSYIKNFTKNFIKQTDIKDKDLVYYYNNKLTFNIGKNADNINGGYLTPNQKISLKYKTKIITSNPFNFSYDTSYKYYINNKEYNYNGKLPKCEDFNNTVSPYEAPIGNFNVINNYTVINKTDSLNNSNINNLYTQISNKSFKVKLIHLSDKDNITLTKFKGISFLSLVDATNINSNKTSCDNANVLYTFPDFFIFNNQNKRTITLKIPNSYKNTAFKINFIDWKKLFYKKGIKCNNFNYNGNLKGLPQCLNSKNKIKQLFDYDKISQCLTSGPYGSNAACNSSNYNANGSKGNIKPEKYNNKYGCAECLSQTFSCSRDNFSIRPANYKINTLNTFTAGKNYNFIIKALNNNNLKDEKYNNNINLQSKLIKPLNCNVPIYNNTKNISFINGESNITYNYNNVGNIKLSLKDNTWSNIDKDKNDCIKNSNNNIPVNGKIGCDISIDKNITFIPKKFKIEYNINNFDNNFTYLSNEKDMSAYINIKITSLTDKNSTATNYTNKCFSKNIKYNLQLNKNVNMNLHFFTEDNNLSKIVDFNNTAADFNLSKKSFINGESEYKLYFNFDRNQTKSVNPFFITGNNFNIYNFKDEDNITANNIINNNNKVMFYYGRIHSPDYTSSNNIIKSKIYYETYCKDCNRTLYKISGKESVDGINWFINTLHNKQTEGKINYFNNINKISYIKTNNINNGIENYNFIYNGTFYPYKENIKIYPSKWLIYNKFDKNINYNYFDVTFLKSGQWAGVGKLGKTVNLNLNTQIEKRIEW